MKKIMMASGQIEKRVVKQNTKGEFITHQNKRIYVTQKTVLDTYQCSEYVEVGIDLEFLRNRHIEHHGQDRDLSDRHKMAYTEATE